MQEQKSTVGQADRSILAGASDRQDGGAERREDHRATPVRMALRRASVGRQSAQRLPTGADASRRAAERLGFTPHSLTEPIDLPPARLAEALAILAVDLVGVLPILDRDAVLERLANRLDDHGRTPGGSETAVLLGAVGRALIRLGA